MCAHACVCVCVPHVHIHVPCMVHTKYLGSLSCSINSIICKAGRGVLCASRPLVGRGASRSGKLSLQYIQVIVVIFDQCTTVLVRHRVKTNCELTAGFHLQCMIVRQLSRKVWGPGRVSHAPTQYRGSIFTKLPGEQRSIRSLWRPAPPRESSRRVYFAVLFFRL